MMDENNTDVVLSKIRTGFVWLARHMPGFTGSFQVTVHYQDGKPKKLQKQIEEHERIDA